ncbi:MAG: hypothetical protein LUF92_02170 [Clostridiales bacterium]|nr:hypothetical protein [Clostridiales bacterium]
MQKIKLFPSPHVEVRICVSDQMIEDWKKYDTGENCGYCASHKCSWWDVEIGDECACGMKEVRRQMAEIIKKADHGED